jgi:hypothetical protein
MALPMATGSASAAEVWQSPSGNIRCAYTNQVGVACYMRHNGRIATLRSFGNSWVGWTRRGLPAGYVLGYGRVWRRSTFSCQSMTSGMQCRSSHTGHGFFISRESTYRW